MTAKLRLKAEFYDEDGNLVTRSGVAIKLKDINDYYELYDAVSDGCQAIVRHQAMKIVNDQVLSVKLRTTGECLEKDPAFDEAYYFWHPEEKQ